MNWYLWLLIACALAGIPYCFANAMDLWRHRVHIRLVIGQSTRRRRDPDDLSERWIREHAYDKDGDAA